MMLKKDKTPFSPYEVGRVAIVPGTSPFVFHVKFQPEALTAVGVLDRLVNVFAEKGVSILLLKVSAARMGEQVTAVLIADLKDKEKMAEELARELRQLPYVSEAVYAPPVVEGAAVDTFSFPLTMRGYRAVIFMSYIYEGLIVDGWSRFGTPYAILLYTVGYGAGKRAYKDHIKITGEPSVQKLCETLFQAVGFGRLEFVKIDDVKREAVFRVYDSFECQLFKGVGEIRGNFVRGLVAGWLSMHWGVTEEFEVLAREVKCIAKGDPYCEYVARVERRTA
ncbi:MAG: hypothetical protein NZ954_01820 [Thermofilaceae archaeon]|nr:hypothetical protein [Thermofilaceae archaeon]MDW8003409.1 hypothetical protein [Thermofilaceae archaeon]